MYYDLKERFWWYGMKRAVAEYVAICDTCQRVNTTYSGAKLAELYISRIVCLHGVPKRIKSDRGLQFTSRFWKQLHDSLDTKLRFSTAYHPQTDEQIERTNQILEDMLRACAIQYGTSWDKCLPYVEFSYNNSYQASLKKSPFEALYGKRRDLSFKVDDHMYLKVSPMRGIRRCNMKGKLAPRYIGPFKILEKKGEVAYRLELPPSLSVEEVFESAQRASAPGRIEGTGGSDLHRASEILETKGSRCAVCSGVIIQRPRQHGNERDFNA
ncbi:hypothetical protein U9M48_035591 [Paspalum notatum var. saurae]|uniref:Integrase catalytic domain-containing protein n=1 Tax=Paspalum notatum var. saurae TaxID=547442 RepID=A0AAQ3UCF5_PASNO